MDRTGASGAGGRFESYVAELAGVIGHADRVGPLKDYCTGLLLPGERKSAEPMASRTAPARASAQHQKLLHFVGVSEWSDARVLAKVRELVLPAIERHGPIEAWILDDTGFPKKGKHSVGVGRQYCGQRGKQDNCQVAVSLSLANRHASLPVDWRLYLPKDWADDAARRDKAGVPAEVVFQTKLAIALDQIRRAHALGLPRGTVLMDAAYGCDAALRAGIVELGLDYAAAIPRDTLAWPAGTGPGPGRRKASRHDEGLLQVREIAKTLPAEAWHVVAWREGTGGPMSSRFARLRVRVPPRVRQPGDHAGEWLLVEWPEGEAEPTKYWLSTLPETISFPALVDIAKLRWRIERDYQELKQEVGLGHYEGRGWRGFHHHATLCIAAYGFLIRERGAFPPSGGPAAAFLAEPALPDGYRPRGAPDASRATRP